MKVAIFVIAACVAVAYCDKSAESKKAYGYEKSYGHEKNDHGKDYGYEKAYPQRSNDHGKDYGKDHRSDKSYGHEKAYGYEEKSYDKDDDHYGKGHDNYDVEYRHGVAYNKQYVYHGEYKGACDRDGFYFKDANSFVICSKNNAYVQKCAPGSRNSGHNNYNYGKNYYYRDFCDINLVDHGYGVHGYGYGRDDAYYGSGKNYGRNDGYYGDDHHGRGNFGHDDHYSYPAHGFNKHSAHESKSYDGGYGR